MTISFRLETSDTHTSDVVHRISLRLFFFKQKKEQLVVDCIYAFTELRCTERENEVERKVVEVSHMDEGEQVEVSAYARSKKA